MPQDNLLLPNPLPQAPQGAVPAAPEMSKAPSLLKPLPQLTTQTPTPTTAAQTPTNRTIKPWVGWTKTPNTSKGWTKTPPETTGASPKVKDPGLDKYLQESLQGMTPKFHANLHDNAEFARFHAVTNPNANPFAFKDPMDSIAAGIYRGQRILTNPKFQQLPENVKTQVLGNFYDKYMAPIYQKAGLKLMPKDQWVGAFMHTGLGANVSNYYFPSKYQGVVRMAMASGAESNKILKEVTIFGLNADKEAAYGALGLASMFHIINIPEEQKLEAQNVNDVKSNIATVNKIDDNYLSGPEFWMQTHPSLSFTQKMQNLTGEGASQLAFFEATGGLRETATEGAEKLPLVGKGMENLTELLGKSKVGQFVVKHLGGATDGFLTSAFQGGNLKQSAAAGASMVVGNIALEKALGIPGKAFDWAAKKWLSKVALVGGKPLVEAITDQADHEMSNGIIGYAKDGTPITYQSDDNLTPEKIEAILNETHTHDPVKSQVVTAQKGLLSHVAREHYAEDLKSGKWSGKWKHLSHSKRNAVRNIVRQMTHEAIDEIAIHNPEVSEAHAEESVKQSEQQSQPFAEFKNLLEQKYHVNVAESLADSEQEQLQKQAGVKSTQGAIAGIQSVGEKYGLPKELAKSSPRYKNYKLNFEDPRDLALYTLAGDIHGIRSARAKDFEDFLSKHYPNAYTSQFGIIGREIKASIKNTAKNADPEAESLDIPAHDKGFLETHGKTWNPDAEDDTEDEPRKFAQFKVDTLSFLKNKGDKFAEGMEPRDFRKEVLDQIGQGHLNFEGNAKNGLLWANRFREHLPSELQNQLRKHLWAQDTGLEPEQMDKYDRLKMKKLQAIWDGQSKNMEAHMHALASTGRLFSEGNIFRSTNPDTWLSSTKWMDELKTEMESAELARINKKLGRWPQVRALAIDATKRYQEARRHVTDPDKWLRLSREIDEPKTIGDWRKKLKVKK